MQDKPPIRINFGAAMSVIFVVVALIVVIFIIVNNANSDKQLAKEETKKTQSNFDQLNRRLDSITHIVDNAYNEIAEIEGTNTGDYFILYNGCEMPKKIGHINFGFINGVNEKNNNKYNITYYNYEKGKFVGETKGKLTDSAIENSAEVKNVKKIATSKKYNAIPRQYKRSNSLPKELMEFADFSTVNIDSVDLDGDGTEEKILCYTVNYKRGEIGDGEPQASSGIILFDSNYKKVSDLVTLQDGFGPGNKVEENKVFLSLDDVEYFDVDNDGIMEIIIEVPTYEQQGGANLSILKYNKGKLDGEKDIQASLLP